MIAKSISCLKTLPFFISLLTSSIALALPNEVSEKKYTCTLDGPANELFDKEIRLDLTTDNKYLTFYGDHGENCNGQRDDQYRQRPSDPPEKPETKYYRFHTDCEREDGFIQILISENLHRGDESGWLKMRIRGAFFHQRYYSCYRTAKF